MRRLYADISPGLGWNGRNPEALEAATATQITPRTATLLTAGTDALALVPRPLAFLVGGTTPSHAPPTVALVGTALDDSAQTETVTLRTNASGVRIAGATCSRKAWKTVAVDYAAGSGTGATVAIGFGLIPGVGDVRGKIHYEYLWEALGDRSSARFALLDELMVDRLGIDASNIVDGRLGEPPGTYIVPFDLPPPGEIGRLALDLWVAEAGKAHPTVIVVDHVTIRKDAFRDLDLLRSAQTSDAGTETAAPTRPANVGGIVVDSGPRTLIDNSDGTLNSGDF